MTPAMLGAEESKLDPDPGPPGRPSPSVTIGNSWVLYTTGLAGIMGQIQGALDHCPGLNPDKWLRPGRQVQSALSTSGTSHKLGPVQSLHN